VIDINETGIWKIDFPRNNQKDIKFRENPSSGSRVVQCGQTDGQRDVTKSLVTSRNFSITPKIISFLLRLKDTILQQKLTQTIPA